MELIDELKQLPSRAIVAFAVRSAMRAIDVVGDSSHHEYLRVAIAFCRGVTASVSKIAGPAPDDTR